MPLIDIEQAVEAVGRICESKDCPARKHMVTRLRALQPAEASDKPSAGCLWCGCERIDWEPTDTVDAMALRCLGCGRWTSPSLHDPPTQRMAEPTAEEVERVARAVGPLLFIRGTTGMDIARAAIAAMRASK